MDNYTKEDLYQYFEKVNDITSIKIAEQLNYIRSNYEEFYGDLYTDFNIFDELDFEFLVDDLSKTIFHTMDKLLSKKDVISDDELDELITIEIDKFMKKSKQFYRAIKTEEENEKKRKLEEEQRIKEKNKEMKKEKFKFFSLAGSFIILIPLYYILILFVDYILLQEAYIKLFETSSLDLSISVPIFIIYIFILYGLFHRLSHKSRETKEKGPLFHRLLDIIDLRFESGLKILFFSIFVTLIYVGLVYLLLSNFVLDILIKIAI